MASNWRLLQGTRRRPPQQKIPEPTEKHPLIPKFEDNRSQRGSIVFLDPLLALSFDGVDPLSQFAYEKGLEEEEQGQTNKKEDSSNADHQGSDFWNRSAILNKYTTTERLSSIVVVTSFLSGNESIKSQWTMAEKVKRRLEQLDDIEEGSVKTMDVSQEEYVQKIEILNHELILAWNNDHRVNSLKIAIQCSKLLTDTSVLRFYPSQFVLVTDVLDIFGRLVYDRLKQKSGYVKPGTNQETDLPDNFTPEMVPEPAKETCQNWFYKIASIRELLPRFYIEVAILKSYNFLDRTEISRSLVRLTKICRGFGDPLVAIYARCYLCRIGLSLSKDYQFLLENINDFLQIYHTVFNNGLRAELMRQKIDLQLYLSLYVPAINYLLQGLCATAPMTVLEDLFKRCCEQKHCALLLHSLMTSFRADFIAKRSVQILNTIFLHCSVEDIVKFNLMRQLGFVLAEKAISQEERQVIFEGAFKFITGLKDPQDYVTCLEPWAEFAAKNFPLKEVNFIINDLLSHMVPDRAFENHYSEMISIMKRIVTNVTDIEGLLTMDNFLPVVDLFQKESYRVDLCKSILDMFRVKVEGTISDPVLINNLMFLCGILNDSVTALTIGDERRQISSLVSHFIKQVNYGKDFEAQLAFYVDARAAFLNLLEAVYATLVTCVVRLMCAVRGYLKEQRHTKKTFAFVKACAAFCFITIPSIESVPRQMELYYLSGAVAVINGCLGQADACFLASINLISQLSARVELDGDFRSADSFLFSYTSRMLTVLIWTPDSPDLGMLYLPHLLMEKVSEFPFENKASVITSYLQMLDFYNTVAMESIPNQIPGLISNDRLYGSDPKFISEVEQTCSEIVNRILEQMQVLGESGQLRVQVAIALDLFQKIVLKSDLSDQTQFVLAGNLWGLAMKNKMSLADPQLPHRIAAWAQKELGGREERVADGTVVDLEFVDSLARLLVKMQRKL